MKVVPNTQVNMLLIGNFTVYSQSCNEVEACKDLDDDDIVTISERSCNGQLACGKHKGKLTVSSDSCNRVEACYKGMGTLKVGNFSCNGKEAVSQPFYLAGFTIFYSSSTNKYAF